MATFFVLSLACALLLVSGTNLPPSCSSRVYCHSDLLHRVQMERLFPDSKTFVDMHMIRSENETLTEFELLLERTNRSPTRDQIRTFVTEYFDNSTELDKWSPTDYSKDPAFLSLIKDENLRQFGKDVNDIWPILGRKVKPEVFENPDSYSLIPITHGFIIPGGRFTEIYYWDTYWIIEGLLISGMTDTARGMIENLIQLLQKLGHVPNGSRVYYTERSQPPLLVAMAAMYMQVTDDREWLREHIADFEKEMNYWLHQQSIGVTRNGETYTLLRYDAPSEGPRPESYYEDYTDAQFFGTDERRSEFYTDIKSAAESGWDFSSRWFIDAENGNKGNITNVHTRSIIPVDLNSIYSAALRTVGDFQAKLHNRRAAAKWWMLSKSWRVAINEVLWSEVDGIWYDFDHTSGLHRKYFYPSNVAPLWMGAVEKELVKAYSPRVLSYLKRSKGLNFPGGVPTSLENSGQQWDFPNAWPPLVSVMVNALEAIGEDEASDLAFSVAKNWVRACYKGFQENKQMFEKYDVETPGLVGGGGEYTVQIGFGWSNGVVLEFLSKYGNQLTLYDTPSKQENEPSAYKTSYSRQPVHYSSENKTPYDFNSSPEKDSPDHKAFSTETDMKSNYFVLSPHM